ncbi:hypothetical protein TNCV_4980521 [Trichonephila clavipes]|nr:hypothetical protein TNCV_4980521 [Trichonephila clavipes]
MATASALKNAARSVEPITVHNIFNHDSTASMSTAFRTIGNNGYAVELHADPYATHPDRCGVRLPDLGVMMVYPPQEVFDNTFKRFKELHTSSANVKYAEGNGSGSRKLLRGILNDVIESGPSLEATLKTEECICSFLTGKQRRALTIRSSVLQRQLVSAIGR